MSNFDFVEDRVFRDNLDVVFDHVMHLLVLLESGSYSGKSLLVSSMRKTIVVNFASIIEAVLLWRLKKKVKSDKIELSDEWKYFDIKTIHVIEPDSEEVIAGKRKKEKKSLDGLDFVRIIDLCMKHNIINKSICEDLHKVRRLRNRLHIGGLKEVEKEYTKKDLDFVFGVAIRVERFRV